MLFRSVFEEIDYSFMQEEMDVLTAEEFLQALSYAPICKRINVKANFTVSGNSFGIPETQTVYIEDGVTLTVNAWNVYVEGKIISDGLLKINSGLIFYTNTDGNLTGNYSVSPGGWLTIYGEMNADDIAKYLSEDSIYNDCNVIAEDMQQLIIDRDLTIPKGKRLSFGYYDHTLVVNEGITLNNLGTITTYMTPIINGTITGNPVELLYNPLNK